VNLIVIEDWKERLLKERELIVKYQPALNDKRHFKPISFISNHELSENYHSVTTVPANQPTEQRPRLLKPGSFVRLENCGINLSAYGPKQPANH